MKTDLYDKRALITGAGRGIGREIAFQLARKGVHVAIAARSEHELEDTASTIRAEGGTVLTLAVDVAKTAGRAALFEMVSAEFGMVDVLINNAATVEPLGHFTALATEGWQSALDTNLIAPAALSAFVLPRMTEAGWGRIVNISSGVVANPASMIGGNVYVSTKAALEAHTVNLAADLSGTGVTVNAYRPGMVDTAMQEWIRGRDPMQVGGRLHTRFTTAYEDGLLITAADSASALLWHLDENRQDSGTIWTHARQ